MKDKIKLLLLEKISDRTKGIEYYNRLISLNHKLTTELSSITRSIDSIKKSEEDDRVVPKFYDSSGENEIYLDKEELSSLKDKLVARKDRIQNFLKDISAMFDTMKFFDLSISALDPLSEIYGEKNANYILSLYAALRQAGILGSKQVSKYLANFEVELNDDDSGVTPEVLRNEIINIINNPQQAAKHPRVIEAVVNHILELEEFHDEWEVEFANKDLGIVSRLIPVIGKDKQSIKTSSVGEMLSRFPFQEDIVANDDLYLTYHVKSATMFNQLQKVYKQVYDKSYKPFWSSDVNNGIFRMNWCVASDNHGFFSSQKSHSSDQWYVTLAIDPVKNIFNYIERAAKRASLENTSYYNDWLEGREKEAISFSFEFAKAYLNFRANSEDNIIADSCIGEAYLMSSVNKHDGSTAGRNVGYHNWINYPGTALDRSSLDPKPKYTYDKFKNIGISSFTIESGSLIKYSGTESVVNIPQGVYNIANGAFNDNDYIKTVIFPYSVSRISNGAFNNCSSLKNVVLTHNVKEIEKRAFDNQILNNANIGVFVKEKDGGYKVVKPNDAYWYPDELKKVGKDSNNKATEIEESKKEPEYITINEVKIDLKNISFKPKRVRRYFNSNKYTLDSGEEVQLYYVEGGKISFNEKLIGLNVYESIEIPEGAYSLITPIYGNYEGITFPRTFSEIGRYSPFAYGGARVLDFSNTSILRIEQYQFVYCVSKSVILPKNLQILASQAFLDSIVSEITLFTKRLSLNELQGGQQNEKTFLGFNSPTLRTVYTDDPLLLEVLASRITKDEAAKKLAKYGGRSRYLEISSPNKYLSSSAFVAQIKEI